MQYKKLALIAALAAPALAQDLSLVTQLPACALGPASAALAGSACGTDIACVCKDASFITDLKAEIDAACTDPADQASALDISKQLCASAGVDLELPAGDSSAAPSSTADAAPTTTAASVSSEVSSALSSLVSDVSSAVSSVSEQISSNAANATTAAPTKPTLGSTITTAAGTSTFTGAAAAITQGAVAGLAGVGALLAFL